MTAEHPSLRRALLAVSFLGLLHACDGGTTANSPARTRPALQVEIAEVVHAPLQGEREVIGQLAAIRHVKIFNQESGRVMELPWQEGDRVRRGDLLVRLDDRLIQAELRKAQANLAQARSDRQRLQSLITRKLVSEEDIARADTAVKLAMAEVSLLQTRLEHTRIRAPFDGIISERRIEPGDVAPLHSHLLSLIDPTQFKAVARVSELLLSSIRPGQAVRLRIDALGDDWLEGRVLRVAPDIDPRTLTAPVEFQVPARPGSRPGQLVRIALPVATHARLQVPFVAVRHDSHGAYVYRLDGDDSVRKVRIVTGLQLGHHIAVTEGLTAGDRIVVKGFVGLREGRKVTVVTAAEPG